jgi:hypothetical protein
MKTQLYISYGLVKSGSTFAFELTKKLFEQQGLTQSRLSGEAVAPGHRINFVTNWNREHVLAMRAEAGANKTTIVLKTHARPRPAIARELEAGSALGHAIFRDPRDMALSLVDAGARAREKGHKAFSEIGSLDDTMTHIDAHLENFYQWVELPGIEPIDYATLTAHTSSFVERLSLQTGLGFDAEPAIADVLENTFIQLNKGVQERWRAEMTTADSERFLERYASVYEQYS